MKTLRLPIDPHDLASPPSRAAIDNAASILRGGGLVAFPTETVYGLGANALSPKAVEKIFRAKDRPAWDPLIVHIADMSMLPMVAAQTSLNRSATALISAFWPGPLTLLLPRAEAVPGMVSSGRPLVGVRMPAHPVARALIAAAGIPLAAPSANSFGRISPTLADHVLEDLDGRIDAVLDGGETTHGLESTVVDASRVPVVIYRPGIIPLREIEQVCGSAVEWQGRGDEVQSTPASMPSPGTAIRHYAPRARLVLIGGEPENQAASLVRALRDAVEQGMSIGIMLPANFLPPNLSALEGQATIFDWGDWRNFLELAHRLFAGLRTLDTAGVRIILCPLPSFDGLGAAIRDRLRKAAAPL